MKISLNTDFVVSNFVMYVYNIAIYNVGKILSVQLKFRMQRIDIGQTRSRTLAILINTKQYKSYRQSCGALSVS